MLTDKEYPATHSMSTSWYMVDDEDNVGIMQFDDNGPVPYGLVHDCSFANNLVFGELLERDERCGDIRLTEEQIHELLGTPHAPHDEDRWYDVVVKVAPKDAERFLEIVHRAGSGIDEDGCVSEPLGLYKIDASECLVNYEGSVEEGSALDQLIGQGIVRAVYTIPELEMDCKWDKEKEEDVCTKDFDSAPYYIYLQPYWTSSLQQRMNVPRFPVKLSQVAEDKRHKLLRIPGRFSEMDRMQIAQWHGCEVSCVGEYRYVGDSTYNLLPTPDGEDRYFLDEVWKFDFLSYCPHEFQTENECVKCDFRCVPVRRVASHIKGSEAVRGLLPSAGNAIFAENLLISITSN